MTNQDQAGRRPNPPNIDAAWLGSHGRQLGWRFEAAAIGAAFDRTGRRLAVALAGGAVARLAPDEPGPDVIQAHADATLHCLATPSGIITGGDDGRVVATPFAGEPAELLHEPGHWIDALAFEPESGLVAAATGRNVRVIDGQGADVARFDGHPSTVAALAFTPAGDAVAAAHYGGVTLHSLDGAPPRVFTRKGSLVAVTVSPDGRFMVAAAQDREVVAWPTAGGEPMEMSGYGAKPLSLSWSGDGRHLATSGADGVIVWPFAGAGGPFGRRPLELAPERKVLVTSVAFHPRRRCIAYGYRDGFCAVTGLSGTLETVAEPDGEAVTTLAWSPDGLRLAACGDSGRVAVRAWPKPGLWARLFG